MTKKPILSIITVTYNCVNDIEPTIQSVVKHKNDAVEYLVIDGLSNDGTLSIIEKYNAEIDLVVSEKDAGIYDAMNKGIQKANGTFVYFINAGDELLNIPHKVLLKSCSDLVCFPVLLSTGNTIFPRLNRYLKIKNTIPHQGCFYKKSDWLKYSLKYRVFADFDLNQKLYKTNHKFEIYGNEPIAKHDVNGISHHKNSLNEIFEVVEGNFGSFYKRLSMLYFKYYGFQNKVRKLMPDNK